LLLIILSISTVKAQQTNTLETYKVALHRQEQGLLTQYGSTLESLKQSFKQKGDLDAVLVVDAEKKRFEENKTVLAPAESKAQFRSAVESYNKSSVDLLAKYVAALDGYVKKLVMADKIEEAKEAKAEKERATEQLANAGKMLPKEKPILSEQSTPLIIKNATYGVGAKKTDVTKILQDHVIDNKLEISCKDYDSIFGDPTRNGNNYLRIEYVYKGTTKIIERQYNMSLSLPPDPNPLVIKKATYGVGKQRVTVTKELQKMVKDNKLEISDGIFSTSFGDPAFGSHNCAVCLVVLLYGLVDLEMGVSGEIHGRKVSNI
jgi:hypothetical protein